MNKVEDQLDSCVVAAIEAIKNNSSFGNNIPGSLRERVDSWQYGKYGWTSPVNLMMTAAWVKWLKNDQDVCKIWARDNDGKAIEGGFSIRSCDEKYTVPLIGQYCLHRQFCSPNSGMQGTRALEKNRLRAAHKRIDRNADLGQKVKFDILLFQNILNDISELNSVQARNAFCFFIEKALLVKNNIIANEKSIPVASIDETIVIKRTILTAVNSFKDPQFVKVVVAAMLDLAISNFKQFEGYDLKGLDGAQTAADARSKTPGDLWICNKIGDVIVGCEVKDSSKTFNFEILAATDDRIKIFPTIKHYLLITAANQSVSPKVRNNPQWDTFVRSFENKNVIVSTITLEEFVNILCLFSEINNHLLNKISDILKITLSLKVDTITNWTSILKAIS